MSREPTKADEVVMLKAFGDDVAALTGGSLKIEVLPALEKGTIDAAE